MPLDSISDVLHGAEAMDAVVTRRRQVFRAFEVAGDAAIIWQDQLLRSPQGSDYSDATILVVRLVGGRFDVIEGFDVDDEARARRGSRSSPTRRVRTPYPDNAVVRLAERLRWLHRHRGVPSATFFTPDCVLDDRRAGVNAGTVGGDAVWQSIESGIEVFGSLALEPLAVRGDRLALFRWAFVADSGFEAPGLTVIEYENGLNKRLTSFDESDLTIAVEELERRHLVLLGDDATDVERAEAGGLITINRRDLAAYEAFLAPDVTVIDHLPLSFPPAHRASDFTRMLHRLYEVAPDTVFVAAKTFIVGRVVLQVLLQRSTTAEGNQYTWVRNTVAGYDAAARLARVEYFPEERWDDALALFDEWAAEPEAPTVERADRRPRAVRVAAFAARDWEWIRGRVAPDCAARGPAQHRQLASRGRVRDAVRRPASAASPTSGSRRSTNIHHRVAWRPPRAAPARSIAARAASSSQMLAVVELDADGRIGRRSCCSTSTPWSPRSTSWRSGTRARVC